MRTDAAACGSLRGNESGPHVFRDGGGGGGDEQQGASTYTCYSARASLPPLQAIGAESGGALADGGGDDGLATKAYNDENRGEKRKAREENRGGHNSTSDIPASEKIAASVEITASVKKRVSVAAREAQPAVARRRSSDLQRRTRSAGAADAASVQGAVHTSRSLAAPENVRTCQEAAGRARERSRPLYSVQCMSGLAPAINKACRSHVSAS
eukprot:IDg19718t1